MRRFAALLLALVALSFAVDSRADEREAYPLFTVHSETGSGEWNAQLFGASVGIDYYPLGGLVTLSAGRYVRRAEAGLYYVGSGRFTPYAGAAVLHEAGTDGVMAVPVYESKRQGKQVGTAYLDRAISRGGAALFVGVRPPFGAGGPFAEGRVILGGEASVALRVGVRL